VASAKNITSVWRVTAEMVPGNRCAICKFVLQEVPYLEMANQNNFVYMIILLYIFVGKDGQRALGVIVDNGLYLVRLSINIIYGTLVACCGPNIDSPDNT
jgi:hypothetical protein